MIWVAWKTHSCARASPNSKLTRVRSAHSLNSSMPSGDSRLAHPAFPSVLKYYGAELNKRRHELIMNTGGADALEWEGVGSDHGSAARSWLRSKANSIGGGTSEIQLNIIAKRILELPGA